ncbi:unnamed protein product [Arabidopsis halleri]
MMVVVMMMMSVNDYTRMLPATAKTVTNHSHLQLYCFSQF